MSLKFRTDDLITRGKRRARREGDGGIQPPEWKALLSEVWGEAYNAVAETGLPHFRSIQIINATGAASYTQPADFLATIGVDRILDSSGHKIELDEIMVQDAALIDGFTGDAVAFAHIADQLYLYPNPGSGTYNWRYIPQPPDLSANADSDLIDVFNADGLRFVVWSLAVLGIDKQESDPSFAVSQRDAAFEKLVDWARLRSFHTVRQRVRRDPDTIIFRDPGDWWPRR